MNDDHVDERFSCSNGLSIHSDLVFGGISFLSQCGDLAMGTDAAGGDMVFAGMAGAVPGLCKYFLSSFRHGNEIVTTGTKSFMLVELMYKDSQRGRTSPHP